MALDDGENGVALLPVQQGCAQVPKEIAPRRVQSVRVRSVIDVVTGGAFGVGHTMGGLKGRHFQKQLQLSGVQVKPKTGSERRSFCSPTVEKTIIPEAKSLVAHVGFEGILR